MSRRSSSLMACLVGWGTTALRHKVPSRSVTTNRITAVSCTGPLLGAAFLVRHARPVAH